MHRFLLIIFTSCLLSSCDDDALSNAELIIVSDQIYTVEPPELIDGAVVIKDGRIVLVGKESDAMTYKSDSTRIINARGSFVMPGLIEGHGHYGGLGNGLYNLNLLDTKSWAEVKNRVAEKVAKEKKGAWIVGRGWHQEKWSDAPQKSVDGYPSHEELSVLSPDNPVMLIHASGHGLMANEAAMQTAGVGRETKDVSGGRIIRDLDKNPIGIFEENAMDLIKLTHEKWEENQDKKELEEKWLKSVELAQQECLKYGITSFQDAGSNIETIGKYKKLAEAGKLRHRLSAMLYEPDSTLDLTGFPIYNAGSGFFKCQAIKAYIDGALGSYGAWLLESYSDKENFFGQNTMELSVLEKQAKMALEKEMQYNVHAIGDRANREVLNIFEKVLPKDNYARWRIEHAQHIHPDDIPRFKELGVIASMQAIHCTSDAPFVEKRLGKTRAKSGAYVWKSLLKSGAVVCNGTDVPVEKINPFENFYATVTRKRIDGGEAFYPEQKLSRKEAIHSMTMACAYANFADDVMGSLEIMKYGDVVILNNNLLTCSEEEILETEVLYTIVGGEVVYEKLTIDN